MSDLTPKHPQRPLLWPDIVLDLQDLLLGYIDRPVYIIGGAVRDSWRQRPIKDLDLATPEGAIELARRIANAMQGDVFVMDAERDVARVLLNLPPNPDTISGAFIIDVARFRGDDLLADLKDRDFTVNAIAVDLLGDLNQIVDPLNGEDDLKPAVIRRCAPTAITNDPLRALRAVRQSAELSARIEPETLKDIRLADLSIVSTERVRDELFKLLKVEVPSTPLRIAGVLHLLDSIIPEIPMLHERETSAPGLSSEWEQTLLLVQKMNGIINTISNKRTEATAARFELGMVVMALDKHRKSLQTHLLMRWANERSHSALLVLTALLYLTGPDVAAARAVGLRLSNDEKKRIQISIANVPHVLDLPDKPGDLEMHRFWYPLGDAGIDVCLLALGHYLSMMNTEIIQDDWIRVLDKVGTLLDTYYRRHDEIVSPTLVVNGNDLIEMLKIDPGPQIGDILKHIREGQVTGEITTIDEALDAARAYMTSRLL